MSITNSKIFSLIGNIAEPSPTIGFLNRGTESIYKRGCSDVVLGLALVHHLHISNRLSFEQISLIFAIFSNEYLIVEFITINENKVQILIKGKSINLMDYNEDNFIKALSSWFLNKEAIIGFSNRISSLPSVKTFNVCSTVFNFCCLFIFKKKYKYLYT
jgi:hypothetical protein